MKTRLTVIALVACLFISILSFPGAVLGEGDVSFSGSLFPFFQISEGNRAAVAIEENYGSLFSSRKVLYIVDMDSLKAERVFSVRDTDSGIFIDNTTVYFEMPRSVITFNLSYGPQTWYSSEIKDLAKKRKWSILYKMDKTNTHWMTFFITIDGVYCRCSIEEGDLSGSEQLLKYTDGQYVTVLSPESVDLCFGDSFVYLHERDGVKNQRIRLFDIKGKRVLTVPYHVKWLPESIVILGDKVYYADTIDGQKSIVCFNALNDETSTVFTVQDKPVSLDLCYDRSELFLVVQTRNKGSVYQISGDDGACTKKCDLPEQFYRAGTEVIMINGILLNGNSTLNELYAYDMDGDNFHIIQFDQ